MNILAIDSSGLTASVAIMKDGKLLFVGSKEELYLKTGKNNVEDAFIKIVAGGKLNA